LLILLGGTAAAGLCLAVPTIASASTFCVSKPSCVGTSEPNVQAALDAAQLHAGPDAVQIGVGKFSRPEGFDYSAQTPDNTVAIKGSGRTDTILKTQGSPSAYDTVFSLTGAPSTVRDLGVTLPAEPPSNSFSDTGFVLSDGTATRVAIKGPASVNNDTGLTLSGNAKFIAGTVSLPFANPTNRGIYATGNESVSTSTIKANQAVGQSGGTLRMTRTILRPGQQGQGATTDGGTIIIKNSLVDLGEQTNCVGLDANNFNSGTDPKTIRADHVTVVGGAAGTTGLRVDAVAPVNNGGQTSSALLTNSVISGPARAIERRAENSASTNPGTSTANVTTKYSNYDASTNFDVNGAHGAGSITATHFRTGVPTFVSATNFHPAAGSILVDRGDPNFSGGVDLAGHKRVVDGDGNGSKITDLGAYERQ
jgi:hypothetical protein